MFSKKPAPTFLSEMPARRAASSGTFSVIGADITITGNIAASADLHVDGTVEGDLACTTLVQGEAGRIDGTIEAETARLAGTVNGTVTARELVILKTARIEGELHYGTLTVEPGARVTARLIPDGAVPLQTARIVDLTPEDAQRLTLAG